jgi:uncharacterized protein involved in exopolysaccharide biosynthesis
MNGLVLNPEKNQDAVTLTLRDVVAPVFRQRRIASLVFIGIFLGAALSALLLPRKYEAEMKILVNRDRVDAVVTPDQGVPIGAQQLAAVSEEDINSEVELLKSRDLLEKVVIACGLESHPNSTWQRLTERASDALHGITPNPEARLARAVQSLDERLTVEPLKKTTIIRIAYTSRDPELSSRVLQSLAALYQEKHAAVHRPAGTFGFFDQQTERYRNELAAAESQLTDFDSKEGVVSAGAQKQLVLQQLSQFEAELQQAQAGAFEAKRRAVALASRAAASPGRQTTQERKIDNAQLLAQLEGTLLSLELKHSEMLLKYAPEYPLVQSVDAQITDARQAITRAQQSPVEEITTDRPPVLDWMATELAKAETEQASLDAQAVAARRAMAHFEAAAQELDRKGAVQDDLARNVKTAEESYLLYLRKREEARISDALDSKRIVNISIAEAATVPALPTLHLAWMLIGGLFIAGVGGAGTAYGADRMDPMFRTPDELGRYLNMKVLASIPASTTGQ